MPARSMLSLISNHDTIKAACLCGRSAFAYVRLESNLPLPSSYKDVHESPHLKTLNHICSPFFFLPYKFTHVGFRF